MILRYLRKAATVAGIVYFTYISHSKIEKTLNNIKYVYTASEQGFVEKEQAFDLKINYEINGKGNLETYLKNYTQLLPLQKRELGIMVGDASYNFHNFTAEEVKALCPQQKTEQKPKEKTETPSTLKHFFSNMFDIWGKKD